MKFQAWIAFAFLLFGSSASAQIFQLNPYIGHQLPMPINTYNGKFNTDGGTNYGLNIAWGSGLSGGGFSQNAFLELQYNYHKTGMKYGFYGGNIEDLGDLTVHNILAGGLKGIGNEKFETYGGLFFGVTIFDPADPEAYSYTRFTMAVNAGLKYYATPAFGIRLNAQLYMPFWGSSYGFGWGGGGYGYVSTVVSPYMNFDVGVFVNIDNSY